LWKKIPHNVLVVNKLSQGFCEKTREDGEQLSRIKLEKSFTMSLSVSLGPSHLSRIVLGLEMLMAFR